MKYPIIMMSIFFTACMNTSNLSTNEGLLDKNLMVCAKDDVLYCEGRNNRFKSCTCVTQQSLARSLNNLSIGL